MTIDKTFLEKLIARAKESPRMRQHYDMRDSEADESQRMLNAIEPGTVIPIHRHTMTSEDVIILQGRAQEVFFNEKGEEIYSCILTPGGVEEGSVPAIHVPMGQYHTCRSLQSGTVIFEFKNTKYNPDTTEDFL